MSLYEGGTLPRKPSGECRQVEVDKSTLFQSTWVNYTTTARDAFEDLEIEQPTDDPFIEPLFNFLFENGRCVKVGEYPYFSAVECV